MTNCKVSNIKLPSLFPNVKFKIFFAFVGKLLKTGKSVKTMDLFIVAEIKR